MTRTPRTRTPDYAGSNIFSRLERGAPLQKVLGQANHERLVSGWPTYGLTTMGRIYYYQHYAAKVAAHPDVAAPDPGPARRAGDAPGAAGRAGAGTDARASGRVV